MIPTDPPEPPPPPRPSLGFTLPGDYYSAPPGDRPRLVSRGVTFGCGIAAMAVLVVIVTGGYFFAHGGLQQFTAYVVDDAAGTIDGKLAKDVPPAQRKELAAELGNTAKNVRDGRLPLPRVMKLLEALQDANKQESVKSDDAARVIREARTLNQTVKSPSKLPR